MTYRILNIEPDRYSREAFAILQAVAQVDELPLSRPDLLKIIHEYDVLITRLAHQIDAEMIPAGTRLKAIATATTGLDHIDLAAAQARGITVLSLKGEIEFLRSIYATAEHTWGLLLALLRHIPQAFESVKQGQWDRDLFRGNELNGKTLGIVGMGRIGEKIARYGLAFGMQVITYDPYQQPAIPDIHYLNSLHELVSTADVVSLHVPLNAETTQLIGAQEFSMMRPGAVLVNTARGAVVDQAALLKALENGRLGGAALDVLADERDFPSPITQALIAYADSHHNLLITPHIGGATDESMAKTEIFIARKIVNFLQT